MPVAGARFPVRLAHTLDDLVTLIGPDRPVVVPTMGALHEGHLSLVAIARAEADRRGVPCVVTIFVNPAQFNDPLDLERYPRRPAADAEACAKAGAHAVLIPSVETVYPPGVQEPPLSLPDCVIDKGLEDAARPGHFEGVCRVVPRLFELTNASAAVFGQKDWQQLQAVRAIAAGFDPSLAIIPGPTIRDPDGLAMSSRNEFLSADDRERALAIPRALERAAAILDPRAAEAAMAETLAEVGIEPDYAAIRDAETLAEHRFSTGRPARALIAAPIGPVRLLDNAPWPGTGSRAKSTGQPD